MKKSLVGVLLTLTLLLTLSGTALADDKNYEEAVIEDIVIEINDDGITPLRYSLILLMDAYLTIDNNIAYCSGEVSTKWAVSKIEIDMYLQKFSGGKWNTVWAKWHGSKSNDEDFLFQRQAPVSAGSYRVYIEVTVTDYDGEEETQTCNSDPKP